MPSAAAGTYPVYACATTSGKVVNHSWIVSDPGDDFGSDGCGALDSREMVVNSQANKTFAPGRVATLTFNAPPGATIADFELRRQIFHFNPVDGAPAGSQMLYSLLSLGNRALEGTGAYDATVAGRLAAHGAWDYDAHDSGEAVVRLSSYSENAGYTGDATFIRFTIGCWQQPCALMTNGAGGVGSIFTKLTGATVTVNDPVAPKLDRVLPTGLAAGGVVGGDEPLTFDASDNAGIKRADLLDVTAGGQVVGSKEFACDYAYAAPCPQAAGAQLTPNVVGAGARTLRLRLTDAAGNVTDGEPFAVTIGGALNGSNATASARLSVTFARNRRGRIDVGFGKRASIRGRLTDAAGSPISGAVIQVLDRELRTGTRYAPRLELVTDADGRFRVLPGRGAARVIRFEYRSRKRLEAPDVADSVSLRVAAGSTLRISPRTVRPRGSFRISGRLRGLPLPRSGKLVDLQAFEAGKWRTFETTRARKGARFSARYRFLRAGSGRSFLIRARIRRDDSYPYYLGYSPRVRVRVR